MTLYQEIRAAGKAMHPKALDATQHLDFHPIRIHGVYACSIA